MLDGRRRHQFCQRMEQLLQPKEEKESHHDKKLEQQSNDKSLAPEGGWGQKNVRAVRGGEKSYHSSMEGMMQIPPSSFLLLEVGARFAIDWSTGSAEDRTYFHLELFTRNRTW